MRNLQAPLWHGAQQALSFQAGDQLAHGAQRHVKQLHQLSLRDKLAGLHMGL
jgi:hypothetical protein